MLEARKALPSYSPPEPRSYFRDEVRNREGDLRDLLLSPIG